MKVLLGIFLLCAAVCAKPQEQVHVTKESISAFDYHAKFGFAEAARVKQAEEAGAAGRIVGGTTAALGAYPYQAGLVITMTTGGTSICGACLFNEQPSGDRCPLLVGWPQPSAPIRSRIGIDYYILRRYPHCHIVHTIRNIALPTNALNQNFAGQWAWASGFGRTSDTAAIGTNQVLSHVRVQVITNAVCQQTFGNFIFASTLCTSGAGRVGVCSGDSGGPLALDWGGQRILIGIASFVSSRGCTQSLPSAFARVTSFDSWIRARL
ncbi:Collagenase [Eumeta japonica]|uniref:Collagenase n=1 Tax=Eumeta variegata TaxID=151549 RepID=A0A4C1VRS5_EUMVA|nr:Collagenase [Eumeta japonica]